MYFRSSKNLMIFLILWNMGFLALACDEDETDWGKETTVDWLKDTGGKACYYRKYKPHEMEEGQKLTEGYLWLSPISNKEQETYIQIIVKHKNKKGWWYDGELAVKTKTGYRTGWFDGCDPTRISIRAKHDGLQSVYVENYGYGEMPEGLILRFDRVPNTHCQNLDNGKHIMFINTDDWQ